MRKIIYFISFFIYSGYYALLALVISIGRIENSRLFTIPLRLLTTVFMGYVIYKNSHNLRKIKKPYILIFITFWILYFFKVLFIQNSGDSLRLYWIEYILYSINFAVFPFLMFASISFKEYKNTILNSIIFSGFIMGIISLYLYKDILVIGVGRISDISYENPEQETLSPLALSYAGALTIILSIYKIVYYKMNTIVNKAYLFITIILSSVMFFLGASRGSLFALVMCLPIFFFVGSIANKIKIFFLVIVAIPLIILGAEISGSSVFTRSVDTIESRSATGREELWEDAWNEFLQYPFLGGKIEIGFYPHNLILEILMATGIVGFILIMMVFAKGSIQNHKIIKLDNDYVWVTLILIQGFSQHMFTGALYFAVLVFFPLGLIYSSYNFKDKKNDY